MRRFSLALLVLVTALAASGSTAVASVTIGQTDPANSPMVSCAGVTAQDMTQPTVTSGTPYVVPADGAIISWSHNAYASANQQITMKVWRLVGGTTYRVVGHDGPRTINGPGLVSITGISVPVQSGDVIGLNSGTGAFVDCMFPAAGDTMLYANPSDAQDGQEVTFTTVPDRRPNISAVVEPDCDKDGLGDESQDPDIASCKGVPLTCKGAQATIVGTDGDDVRTGSPGRDVMVGLAGNDTLSGLAGKDVICGGAGKDKLKGGKGNDFLSGQKGNDTLKGGPGKDKLSGKKGKDLCIGGPGTDKAKGCERTKSI
jgi:Ca2+-binding RTX toxin-like protein